MQYIVGFVPLAHSGHVNLSGKSLFHKFPYANKGLIDCVLCKLKHLSAREFERLLMHKRNDACLPVLSLTECLKVSSFTNQMIALSTYIDLTREPERLTIGEQKKG